MHTINKRKTNVLNAAQL